MGVTAGCRPRTVRNTTPLEFTAITITARLKDRRNQLGLFLACQNDCTKVPAHPIKMDSGELNSAIPTSKGIVLSDTEPVSPGSFSFRADSSSAAPR